MTKRTRTILFFICLSLFLLATPFIVFYTQGYRFDLEEKRFSQTGGFFFKVTPKQAEIYLDGKLAKKTDFFFGSALIEDTLPKQYKVEIKKEGFSTWEKNLEIKEKEVTETKTIVLFPENPEFKNISRRIENCWISPDQKNLILQETENSSWSLKLYDLDKNLKSHLISERDISAKGAGLISLEFSSSKEISLEVGATERLRYFSLEIDKAPAVLTEKNPPLVLKENFLAYQEINSDTYYLDAFGYVFKADSSFSTKQRMNEKPFPIKQETEYKLKIFQDAVFLQENKALYKLNLDSRSFEKFFEGLKDLKISPNFKKLAYFSDYEIWILFLKDDQPRKKAGDKVLIVRLSEKISDLAWLNSDYIAFNSGQALRISEIDERDKVNIIDVAQYQNPKILWSENKKELYVLSEENLYQSEKLMQ